MIRLFVRYAPTILLAVFCIVAFGSLSYIQLPRESSPDVKIPVVLVTTPYVGVSPVDVESLVTIPLENELAGIKDIKKMSSTSAEGASIISLEFEPEVVIEDALQRVRDRVNRAKPDLPDDAEEPQVQEVSLSDVPIMIVTIAGPVDLELLKEYGERLEDETKRISGVLDAKLSGGRTRQIRVQFDPRRLARYGFSHSDIISAIQNENVNIPGGEVTAGDSSFLVRVPGEFDTVEQIMGVAVKRKEGRPVFVRDLARVVDGFADADTYARMNGQPAVSLAITKRSGANIIDIADEVREIAAEQAGTWEEGVEYRVLADQSTQIRDMVSDLQNNILTALILVVGVVLFFMGARNSLFVAIAIPLSMLMSFVVISVFGMTLNMIVLFSLILALGMLVDNAIVVVENVYRHMEEGKTLIEASIDGTREVALAVAASTATTVAAFFPMVFWQGIMGQFMGYLPKTVIIVLVSSLVVAVAILPVATSRLMQRTKSAAGAGEVAESDHPLMQRYKSLLIFSIRNRYTSAVLGFATLFFTFVAYGFLNHGTEFFPDTEPDRATVAVRTADGTDLERTDEIVRQIEAILSEQENVDVYVAETGVSGGGSPLAGSQANASAARLTVDFLPDRNSAKEGEQVRIESTRDTIDRLRNTFKQIPGAEITIEKEELGPPVGPPVGVEVSGPGFEEVGELASVVRREINKIQGAADVKDDYRVNRPELRLQIDRGAAKRIGSSTGEVANAIRTAVAGTTASTLRDGKDEYDIVVEMDPRFSDDVQSILDLRIPGREDKNPDTFSVPLSAVASYSLVGGSGAIKHVDQELVVTIEGNIAEGYNENDVRQAVQSTIDRMKADGQVPEGFDLRLGGANDEQRDATAFLGRAFIIAVALIAVVLVTQFNSFSMPAIILASVILSLVGVLWGLIITGTPFGVIMTGIGVISLAGVVVNNAIVLLDYVEQLRERGHEMEDALIRAGMTRFRPVMLTAITTILGLVPMAVGVSFDFANFKFLVGGRNAEFWGPMAIAVIFGLLFATILTLVMVPTLYSIVEDFNRFVGRLFGRRTTQATAAVSSAVILVLALVPGVTHARTVTLEQALAAAEDNNINLALTREQTIQARTLKGKAISNLGPKLSVNGSYTYNEFEDVTFPNIDFNNIDFTEVITTGEFPEGEETLIQAQSFFSGNATLSQPLFNAQAVPGFFGARRTYDKAKMDESWARTQIRSQVASAYYQLALTRESIPLAEKAVALAERQQDLAEKQVESGLATQRDLLEVSLELSRTQRDLQAAQQRELEAAQNFTLTTGIDADAELVVPAMPLTPSSRADVVDAVSRRSDVQSAEEQIQIARLYNTGYDLAWLPTFDANFTYIYTENPGFVDSNFYWTFQIQGSWTIWDGGARLATQFEQASLQRSATLQALLTRQQAEQELINSWESLEQAKTAYATAERQVRLAEENLKLAEANEQAGSSTALEADNARLLMLQAQVGLLQERVTRDLAAVRLRAAMGDY
ncbi:MAG: efflux RND transporter permease subunit [Myxococcota bacterium]